MRVRQSGVLVNQKTHPATAAGSQSGTMDLLAEGLMPGTALQMRVRSAGDGNCSTVDTDNAILLSDTWTSLPTTYRNGAACAKIQRATCSQTHRVVAVDCQTGAILPTQPADWPVQAHWRTRTDRLPRRGRVMIPW